jgi:hypothetical protein
MTHEPTARWGSPLPVLAGVVLIVVAIAALLLGGVFLFVSIFPPVAAIEGRASPDQSQYGPALACLVVAVAGFWAGARALRRVRSGRLVGVAVMAVSIAFLAWWLVGIPDLTPAAAAVLIGLAVIHVLVALVLLAWPPDLNVMDLPAAEPHSAGR